MRPFSQRHIGPNADESKQMLDYLNLQSISELIDKTIPDSIRMDKELDIPIAIDEHEYLQHMRKMASKNETFRSFIGQGYYGTFTQPVIQRCILENPGWYTQYTPYQAEISQGRLEALLNFQTVITELTGLPIANASLLDEGTAAAEAMIMFYNQSNKRNKTATKNKIHLGATIFKSTLDVLKTRASALNIILDDTEEYAYDSFAIVLQYPDAEGCVKDFSSQIEKAKATGLYIIVVADVLSLCLLKPPGAWGADAVVGSTQRFGIPMGYGGPHAAFFATHEKNKRLVPGRIIGVSKDKHGNPAYRMALQTREQHIKRERATSNICTAQALLAIMAGMHAVYHGSCGLRKIANTVHNHALTLAVELSALGFPPVHNSFFDTLRIRLSSEQKSLLLKSCKESKVNIYSDDEAVQISLDELTSEKEIAHLLNLFKNIPKINTQSNGLKRSFELPINMQRQSAFLKHPVFSKYQNETKMMRYLKKLENKDLSLVHSMIALGSCTMKLNAAAQLMPISWPEFANVHPMAPKKQVKGYRKIIKLLEKYLCEITGLHACSLQPNAGAQGEYAGLLAIRHYQMSIGQIQRNIVLIPFSAHGTNPASAVMAGMQVRVVQCDESGNIDIHDLESKIKAHLHHISAIMITYPSTHGVFESHIKLVCDLVHQAGGQVYMDGANMNAQVGYTSPGVIGADVCHLNLHKTFSIPHGGGGPGMGPICVGEHLATYLPGHMLLKNKENAIASAPYGSASILLISYGYIRLLGYDGLKKCTEIAILNSNYIRTRLEAEFEILYLGEEGYSAHELIVDLRPFRSVGVSAEDVSKRLMDYGFHSPTLSFPVPGTIMIEPTESEDKAEMDRFCDALISIKKEIDDIAIGKADLEDNVLKNAPHSLEEVCSDDWEHPYSKQMAAFPLSMSGQSKFWPAVARIDNASGDRNLICTCPDISQYELVNN